jgi:hypothetical protein
MKFLTSAWAFITRWWKVALAFIAAVSLSFTLGQCDGQKRERTRWEAAAEKHKADGLARARAADEQRRNEVGASNTAIITAREELDNATRNLPDQSPSARRRARVCLELRDQARRSGTAAPAC